MPFHSCVLSPIDLNGSEEETSLCLKTSLTFKCKSYLNIYEWHRLSRFFSAYNCKFAKKVHKNTKSILGSLDCLVFYHGCSVKLLRSCLPEECTNSIDRDWRECTPSLHLNNNLMYVELMSFLRQQQYTVSSSCTSRTSDCNQND